MLVGEQTLPWVAVGIMVAEPASHVPHTIGPANWAQVCSEQHGGGGVTSTAMSHSYMCASVASNLFQLDPECQTCFGCSAHRGRGTSVTGVTSVTPARRGLLRVAVRITAAASVSRVSQRWPCASCSWHQCHKHPNRRAEAGQGCSDQQAASNITKQLSHSILVMHSITVVTPQCTLSGATGQERPCRLGVSGQPEGHHVCCKCPHLRRPRRAARRGSLQQGWRWRAGSVRSGDSQGCTNCMIAARQADELAACLF